MYSVRSIITRPWSVRHTKVATWPHMAKTAEAFTSKGPSELAAWLASHNIPTELYGQGKAKKMEQLFEEVENGESILRLVDGAPLREVIVLNLLLVNEDRKVLRETRQQLPDGRVRVRDLAVSEKMMPGEGWREAVVRAIAEELGSVAKSGWQEKLVIDDGSYASKTEDMASPSYPGLVTAYTMHCVRAQLPRCLPREPFKTEEQRPDGKMVTWWEWREERIPNDL